LGLDGGRFGDVLRGQHFLAGLPQVEVRKRHKLSLRRMACTSPKGRDGWVG
jgi:hypothetical protein